MEKESNGKEGYVMLLQRTAKKLQFGSWEEKDVAAKVIEEGLAKQDVKVRELASELGVVRVLVSMAASEVATRRRVGLKTLIQLSNGTHCQRNKDLIVEAGILSKLPKKIDLADESTSEFAHLLSALSSSLSSLENTHFPHSSIQFLIDILKTCSSFDTKQSCLVALSNISALLENAGPLVSNGVVAIVLELSLVKGSSEKALTILGNLGVTSMGKKAIENSSMVPECLIEILSWEDEPKCQELSAYILIILANKNSTMRDKMAQSGIVSVLLEIALLGSSLVHKRALKLLQWFKDDRQIKMEPQSGPQTSRNAKESLVNQRNTKEGKRMMKNLVKESLHRNMEIITNRANAAGDSSNKLKSMVLSTSSISLPY
ncbi:U-box domain-containing protein 7, partial [Mucuna pruriens]